MIYGHVNVFQMYSALLTARSEKEFVKLFCDIVKDAVEQFESSFSLSLEPERKCKIMNDMEDLASNDRVKIDKLFYDLTIDGCGYVGIVEVAEVYYNKQDVIERYQPWVDQLNQEIQDILEPDLLWAVFGGGFFPEEPGYEMDYLFK